MTGRPPPARRSPSDRSALALPMPRPALRLAALLALLLPAATVRAQHAAPTDAPAATVAPAPARPIPTVGAGTVAAQVGLGTVTTLGGFVGGGLVTRAVARRLGASVGEASDAAYVGAYAGAALATPVVPVLLARRGGARAAYTDALAGTLVGGAASVLVVQAGRRGAFGCRACGPLRLLAGASAFVLPSVGATIAANRSRRPR